MRKEVVVKTVLIILFALAVAYDTAASHGLVSASGPKVDAAGRPDTVSDDTSGQVMNTSLFRTIANMRIPSWSSSLSSLVHAVRT
jgi:hypothetical protein